MRELVCTVIGVIGSALAYLLGGWDTAIIALCVFMLIDLITGVVLALVFHKSPKNNNGKLESKPFWKGLAKKVATIMLVCVAHLMDKVLGIDFLRTGTVICLMANETISIVENCGLMGIPIPAPIRNGIELLTKKENET